VHPPDSPEIRRHLLFRDWLRTHDDDRDQYERTKRELASRTWKYVQHCADAKTVQPLFIIITGASGSGKTAVSAVTSPTTLIPVAGHQTMPPR
jgi:hypothetical protein